MLNFHKSIKTKHLNLKTKRRGQILIISLIFFFISIMLIGVFLSQTTNFISFFGRSVANESAKQLADGGLDRAIAIMNYAKPATFPYTSTFQPSGWPGEIKFTIEDIGGAKYKITSSGYVSNSTSPRGKRTVSAIIQESGALFPNLAYAVQVGSGGIQMGNPSSITSSAGPGNVYSNGQIICGGTATISGIVYASSFFPASTCPTTYGEKHSGAPPLALPPDNSDAIIGNINGGSIDCAVTPQLCTIPNDNPPSPVLIGNKTYIGNLTISCAKDFSGSGCVQVTGPIHVTGNFTMSNNAKLQVHSSVTSGVGMVVDGSVSIGGYASINPNSSAYPYSDLMIISKKNDYGAYPYAIDIAFFATAKAVFIANTGTINVQGSTQSLRQATANKLMLGSQAGLVYDIGIASELFGVAPGGGVTYQIQKGTYQSVATPNHYLAVYNSTYKAPYCANVGTSCDSGNLLNGRDNVSGMIEPNNAQNATDNCTDENVPAQNRIDSIKVRTANGTSTFKAGGSPTNVIVNAKGYFSGTLQGVIDFYYKNAISNPSWTPVGTIGLFELNDPEDVGLFDQDSQSFPLSGSPGFHVVRAQFRDHVSQAASCTWSSPQDTDESDDLVFNVG